MIVQQLLLYSIVLAVTWGSPFLGVLGFVLIAPCNWLDFIGWDPRLGWSLIIGCFAIARYVRSGRCTGIPAFAFSGVLVFYLLAYGGVIAGNRDLTPSDMEACTSGLHYLLISISAGFAVLVFTQSEKDARLLLLATCISTALISLVAFAQASLSYVSGQVTDRIPGTLSNPNAFAAFLAIAVTILVVGWRSRLVRSKWLIVTTVAAVTACLLTFSRMGAVACVLGACIAAFVRPAGPLITVRTFVSLVVVLAVAAGLTVGYLAGIRRSVTVGGNDRKAELAAAGQAAEDLTRLEAAQFGLATWVSNPILGVGLGTLAAHNFNKNGLFVTTHDTYLQVLAGMGLVGAGLLVAVLASLNRKLKPDSRRFMYPAFAAFALCSFFGDYVGSIDITIAFCVLFAIVRQIDLHRDLPKPGRLFICAE